MVIEDEFHGDPEAYAMGASGMMRQLPQADRRLALPGVDPFDAAANANGHAAAVFRSNPRPDG